MSRWQRTAIPPSADSSRILYLNQTTGEMCYRVAAWKSGGSFLPHDDAPGIGIEFDRKTGAESETGKVYPVDEF